MSDDGGGFARSSGSTFASAPGRGSFLAQNPKQSPQQADEEKARADFMRATMIAAEAKQLDQVPAGQWDDKKAQLAQRLADFQDRLQSMTAAPSEAADRDRIATAAKVAEARAALDHAKPPRVVPPVAGEIEIADDLAAKSIDPRAVVEWMAGLSKSERQAVWRRYQDAHSNRADTFARDLANYVAAKRDAQLARDLRALATMSDRQLAAWRAHNGPAEPTAPLDPLGQSFADTTDSLTSTPDPKPTWTPFTTGSDAACPIGESEIRDDQCSLDGPHSPEAITGVHFYLTTAEERLRGFRADKAAPVISRDYRTLGPGKVGPYLLHPYTQDDRLVYFVAHHAERAQNEWLIGPENAQAFASTVEIYAGTAAQLLPGSVRVPGSQADGADAVRDPDSVLKQEAFGEAPWQALDTTAEVLNGGGGAMNFARNARLRMTQYVEPAKRLAEQLAADVTAGKIDHLDARAQAVDGRNQLLDKTRSRQTPAARYASRKLKEEGKTVGEMTEKKVKDNLDRYRVSDETRKILDADSDLWAKYANAMDAGDDAMKAAFRELGQSPAVSRSIIESAGKTNRSFTRLARWGGPIGLAIGALGAADMVVDIKDAIEADNWHAAAREMAGFAGGIVGGELGAMGAVWIASALIPGAGAGVIIVASIIGGAVGGGLAAHGAEGLVDLLADGAVPGGFATPLAAAGGFSGVHAKDGARSTSHQVSEAIFSADGELAALAVAIPQARGRHELQALQRKRLEVLARRQQMEDLLTALRLGVFDGAEESKPEPPEPVSPPAATPPPSDCEIDNDCDSEYRG